MPNRNSAISGEVQNTRAVGFLGYQPVQRHGRAEQQGDQSHRAEAGKPDARANTA